MAETRIIRAREAMEMTGLSRSTLYRYARNGRFPTPVRLGPQSIGWRLSEVEEWIRALSGPDSDAERPLDPDIEALL